jgi:MEMO1 family protein
MEQELTKRVIRKAAVAGQFYPGTEKKLNTEVEDLLNNAKTAVVPGKIPQALIVPHAGYVFSGKVAASAYNQLVPGNFPRRVFILASSHQFHFPGVSVYCAGDYETPLGKVIVDVETGQKLTKGNSLISTREDVHLHEHSLEVQLPFLQVKLKQDFQLVPLILGMQRMEECRLLAEILRPYFTPENLFIISSDFSHYPGYNDAVKTDRVTTQAILSNSPAKLMRVLEENKKQRIPGLVTSLCGWTSVLTLLFLTEGSNYEYEWIDYQNSGDQPVYGDHERVVGYSALAVYQNSQNEFSLTSEEKDRLMQIAVQSVKKMVTTENRNQLDDSLFTGRLTERYGAFVSIYVAGKLRGCIGSFRSEESLVQVVNEVAASATRDHRFDPVTEAELQNLSIEISVLSPLKKISSPKEIILGKHGIYIRKAWSTGTFLPQVATKYGWTLDEFLGRCSRDKAGIGWDGWKTAELFTYEAIVFGKGEEN